MSFFDFFFPEQAQASHLRTLAQRSRRADRRERTSRMDAAHLARRVSELEANLGFVSLLLGTVMAKLDEDGHISREEIQSLLREVDGADGLADGQLDIDVLRGLVRGDDAS